MNQVKKVYAFDPTTFEFMGVESAYIDPLESEATGQSIFIIPAYATENEPPECDANQVAIFDLQLGKWIVRDDFRGQIFYEKSDGGQVVIDEVGELPDTVTNKPCPYPWSIFDNELDNWVIGQAEEAAYISQLKQSKQLAAATDAQAYIDAVTQDFAPTFERESYVLQAAEAAMWNKDKSAKTPILDGIAAARGVDPDVLKAKALEKSQQYQALCAVITGQRQAYEDRINAAQTSEELDLIVLEFGIEGR